MINIVKSQPAPACLAVEKAKANGTYRCGDVLSRLVIDFFNKCYLCGEHAPSSLNIEHFLAHHQGKNRNLLFDWLNLFLVCSHCNNTKLAKAIYDHILNCTDPNDLVTEWIEFHINPYPMEHAIITARKDDVRVQNTVALLDEIYKGKTLNKELEANNIRRKIVDEICSFQKLLLGFYELGMSQEEKDDIKRQIRRKISLESPFTAFKLWIIKRNAYLMTEFGSLLP